MRQVTVYRNEELAGVLTENDEQTGKGYTFRYDDAYFYDARKYAISLTLPKTQQEYHSENVFPFFSNLITEGANLSLQSRYLKIDKRDVLGLLLATAGHDSIGNITIKGISKEIQS